MQGPRLSLEGIVLQAVGPAACGRWGQSVGSEGGGWEQSLGAGLSDANSISLFYSFLLFWLIQGDGEEKTIPMQ